MSTDFLVQNHGSICILQALTEAAKDWVNEHLPEDAQTWGTNGTMVEPRYLQPILAGIEADGLSIR